MTAIDIILSLNLIFVYFLYFQLRKEVSELRKESNEEADIIESNDEASNMWRTKDNYKKQNTLKTN